MQLIKEDITNETEGLILHSVNCMGKMGSGVALAIKKKWPKVYSTYTSRGTGERLLGCLDIIKISEKLFVGNGYGQIYYGYDGTKYADPVAIDFILYKAFNWCYLNKITLKTIKLGCGLGGLSWDNEIKDLFEKHEKRTNINVNIFQF